MRPKRADSGSALLTVLWLCAALSAIAFTVASTVRAETDRTATTIDSLRAYYLATAGIDRALLYIQWGAGYRNPDGSPRYFVNPTPALRLPFPTGEVITEIIPETARLNVNIAPASDLSALLLALAVPAAQTGVIVQGIVDWRTPTPGGAFTGFDQYYLGLTPSFRARHASFQEIEELLLVRGVTPELFYGGYTRDAQGNLLPHSGLKDCLSVYGSFGPVDMNTAPPEVMQAIGVSPDAVQAIVARRRLGVIKSIEDLAAYRQSGPGFSRLGLAPCSIATLRSTARLRLSNGKFSDLRRTVSALVKFLGPEWNPPYHVLRWYDYASNTQ